MALSHDGEFIRWFDDISLKDLTLVGGKNASLGEMTQELSSQGICVPEGFAITAKAYRYFLEKNNLEPLLRDILSGLQVENIDNLKERGERIRQAILQSEIPTELQEVILKAYKKLQRAGTAPISVAVRSSATAEDLPDSSFAGQLETFLNVQGGVALLEACRKSFASLFTDRALSYRAERNFDHLSVSLSVGVQKMVRSDLACAGVMFTIDTETGFPDVVLINSSYGLGESVVQGTVNPDEYLVFKPTLKAGFASLINRSLGDKELKIIYEVGGTKGVKTVVVPQEDRRRFSLTEEEVLTLSRWACRIEDLYSKKYGRSTPMDIEWAKDGQTGELFIVQARPETVQSRRKKDTIEVYKIKSRGPVIVRGRSVGGKVAQGTARVIKDVQNLKELRAGDILVTDKTDPDWEPAMKKVAAIVTNRGGRTCHAAIVSRELGLPAVIGTLDGTTKIQDGQRITVSCAEGDEGFVYEGSVDFSVDSLSIPSLPRPQTKIMMNVSNPEEALRLSMLPNSGVGLAREEFIIANSIQIHPLALVNFANLEPHLKKTIEDRTPGYTDKSQFFIDKLAEGVGTIAAAFYPKDVIVRMSDFKTNEYAHLLGGELYEPKEENPMLGFRGASRYYDPRYREGFALECKALKKVREVFGLTNVKVMIPFCRTLEEGKKVLEEMKVHGLERGYKDLEVYVMCEIPSNVILAEEFFNIFDGFSIGSNDLTQLILGVDRDSEIVAPLFNEKNEAVKKMISDVIGVAKRMNKKIGICGQAPSDYPDFAEFLVRQGIDSLSLNPDAVVSTLLSVSKIEHQSSPRSH